MTCIVEGCERQPRSLSLCAAHYQQFYIYGKILPRPLKPMTRYNGATCGVRTCSRTATDKGYCFTHYQRLRLYGDLMVDKPIREFVRRKAA